MTKKELKENLITCIESGDYDVFALVEVEQAIFSTATDSDINRFVEFIDTCLDGMLEDGIADEYEALEHFNLLSLSMLYAAIKRS